MDGSHRACVNPRGDDVNLRSGPQMREYERIVKEIRAHWPRRILDWGCGYGQVSDLLWRSGLEVTSFDYLPGAEDGVRPMERYPHLNIHLSGDPRRIPFDDGSFDGVLSCGVLEHVEDPDASLEEIRRVLVPGGTFYVYKLPNRMSYLEAIARRVGLYYHGALEHDRLYDPRSARQLLTRHGLTVRTVRRMNMLPLTLTSPFAIRASRAIWVANRALSAIPGLNLLASNIEVIASTAPGSRAALRGEPRRGNRLSPGSASSAPVAPLSLDSAGSASVAAGNRVERAL